MTEPHPALDEVIDQLTPGAVALAELEVFAVNVRALRPVDDPNRLTVPDRHRDRALGDTGRDDLDPQFDPREDSR